MIAEFGVHRHLGVSKLKALVKNFKQMRFTIDRHHVLHACAAQHFIHGDMYNEDTGGNYNDKWDCYRIDGYIEAKGETIQYRVTYSENDSSFYSDPWFEKFDKAGFKRARKKLDFEW